MLLIGGGRLTRPPPVGLVRDPTPARPGGRHSTLGVAWTPRRRPASSNWAEVGRWTTASTAGRRDDLASPRRRLGDALITLLDALITLLDAQPNGKSRGERGENGEKEKMSGLEYSAAQEVKEERDYVEREENGEKENEWSGMSGCTGSKGRERLGILGTASAAIVAVVIGLPLTSAILCFMGISTAVAIADVTIDACIAKNSIDKPALAPDMQSLCAFSSSLGALIGYATSGMFVHHLGAQGALGVMTLPPAMLVFLGFVIHELKMYQHNVKEKVLNKVSAAVKGMVQTIKYPVVWKPSLYMFLSLALSISTHEGQFYWYTNKKPPNPGFSQEFVGMVHAIGAVASMVGVLIYHKYLKDYPFRSILFYAQLLYGVSGLLDLTFVLRWNLKLGVPDSVFVTLEECCSRVIGRVRLMPMMVLSTKLCPPGVEGTFFALLMCIDSLGMLVAKTGGAVVLRALRVTRTDFGNLWLAVLLRNLLRLSTLGMIFLVPTADQTDVLIPHDLLSSSVTATDDEERLQLAKFTTHTDDV